MAAPVGLLRSIARRFALLLAGVLLAGCGPSGPAYEHEAARMVADLLELRSRAATDPADYAPFFADSAVATALADDAVSRGDSPQEVLPKWERPYVSAETTAGGVDVVVVWRRSGETTGEPPAHRFVMVPSDDTWRITDAIPLTREEIPDPFAP